MAFVLLDGEEFDVVTASGSPEDVAGKVARNAAGNIRSSVRKTVTPLSMTLLEMSAARYATLVNIIGNGAPIPVAGDAFPAPLTASVRIRNKLYVRDGAGHLIVPTIEITPE